MQKQNKQANKTTVTFRKYSGGKVLDRNTSLINKGLPKPEKELESTESTESKHRARN